MRLKSSLVAVGRRRPARAADRTQNSPAGRALAVWLTLSVAASLWLAPAALAQASFSGPTNFAAGGFPFSVAVGDFDGDADPDLAVANNRSWNVSVLLNTTPPPNQAPSAVDDAYTHFGSDTPLVVPAPGVLANDTDVDGDPLTAIKVTDPDDGSLMLDADGSFRYQPLFPGGTFDFFHYKANDGTADSNQALVTITVLPGCGGRPPTITGTNESDTLRGTPGDDVIDAGGGDDKLLGGGGDDVLCGGFGDDRLNADRGDDHLDGGPGDDRLNADSGNDRLLGRDGADTLHADTGDDTLSGGPGAPDACHGGGGSDILAEGHGCERTRGVP